MEIIVNGEKKNIEIIDPETGLSWIEDFLGNNGAYMASDDDGRSYMDSEEFDWWHDVAEKYQAADYRHHKLWEGSSEWDRFALMKERWLIGCDIEDYPAALQRVCDDHELQKKIDMVKDLDELYKLMLEDDPAVKDRCHVGWSADLPTFGGEDAYNEGAWSWDEKRLIVGTCSADLKIINREGELIK